MIIGTANGLERLDKCPVSTPYLISSGPDCHIRCVRCVKYLGIIVDDTITWEEHIEYILVKIKRGIDILKVTGKFLKRESLILIYRTLIVDDTITWEEHIEYILVKIKRGIGILKVTGKFLKRESLILIYRTLIEPYLK